MGGAAKEDDSLCTRVLEDLAANVKVVEPPD